MALNIDVISVTKESEFIWKVRCFLVTDLNLPIEYKCRGVCLDLFFGIDVSEKYIPGQSLDFPLTS